MFPRVTSSSTYHVIKVMFDSKEVLTLDLIDHVLANLERRMENVASTWWRHEEGKNIGEKLIFHITSCSLSHTQVVTKLLLVVTQGSELWPSCSLLFLPFKYVALCGFNRNTASFGSTTPPMFCSKRFLGTIHHRNGCVIVVLKLFSFLLFDSPSSRSKFSLIYKQVWSE